MKFDMHLVTLHEWLEQNCEFTDQSLRLYDGQIYQLSICVEIIDM